MPRLFTEKKLVIATHNKGKLAEFQSLLTPYGVEVTSAGELGLPEPEETGDTFEENALIKARAAVAACGLPSLADDSGLCVEALGGAPGVHTARWCGPSHDAKVGMERIVQELGTPAAGNGAYFISVLALVWPDGHSETVTGRCDGTLIDEPRGSNGHGFDPWFVAEGGEQTFAEMSMQQKQQISHRGRAMQALLKLFARHG